MDLLQKFSSFHSTRIHPDQDKLSKADRNCFKDVDSAILDAGDKAIACLNKLNSTTNATECEKCLNDVKSASQYISSIDSKLKQVIDKGENKPKIVDSISELNEIVHKYLSKLDSKHVHVALMDIFDPKYVNSINPRYEAVKKSLQNIANKFQVKIPDEAPKKEEKVVHTNEKKTNTNTKIRRSRFREDFEVAGYFTAISEPAPAAPAQESEPELTVEPKEHKHHERCSSM